MIPTKGFRFYHAKWLSETGEPLLHVVSRVARGAVYMRPVYSDGVLGKPSWCAVEKFTDYVMRPE